MSVRRICVFCASSQRIHQDYISAAQSLGHELARQERVLVYGGGNAGLMGSIANAALEKKGTVIGVIPQFMTEVEWAHDTLSELRVVGDMHERVQVMIRESDAFCVLPGGSGTFDELFQVLTWKRLGLHGKPIVLANIRGYFDPCIEMLHRTIQENFMDERHRDMWRVVDKIEDVLPVIDSTPPWDENAMAFAAVR